MHRGFYIMRLFISISFSSSLFIVKVIYNRSYFLHFMGQKKTLKAVDHVFVFVILLLLLLLCGVIERLCKALCPAWSVFLPGP